MVRASQVSKILSKRYEDNSLEIKNKIKDIKVKDSNFKVEDIDLYRNVRGYKKLTDDLSKLLNKQSLFNTQPLPPGGMNYLQLVWLEENYGFKPIPEEISPYALHKGNTMEEEGIKFLGNYKKNVKHVKEGFLSGTADIVLSDAIWDIKIPVSWESFRDKTEVPPAYWWQIVAYCHLYKKPKGEVIYLLMENPVDYEGSEQFLDRLKEENKIIKQLKREERIKVFEVNFSKDDVNFMLNRLDQAEKYYKSLTYNKCMKI